MESFILPITVTDEWEDDEKYFVACASMIRTLRKKCPKSNIKFSRTPLGKGNGLRNRLRIIHGDYNREIAIDLSAGKSYSLPGGKKYADSIDELISKLS